MKSKLVEFFLIRKTFAILLALSLLFAGIFSYKIIIKEALPDLVIPYASISTYWNGASQSIMEKEVTTKIEQEIRDIPGLKEFSSESMESSSSISVQFEADAPMEESMRLLRQRVDKSKVELPKQVKTPEVEQDRIRDMPILSYIVYGDLDEVVLGNAAKKLQKRLKTVRGIRKISLYGDRKYYVSVKIYPNRLKSLNISPTTVSEKLQEHDLDVPLGVYENREFPVDLKTRSSFNDLESIRTLPITRIPNGRVIQLKEIAEVSKRLDDDKTIASFSYKGSEYQKGITLSVLKIPGTSTIELVEQLDQEVERAKDGTDWPVGMEIKTISNNAELIKQDLDTIFTSGWQSVLIVFAVLLFLLTWREALIAALCIPITLCSTIVTLYLLGYTFNMLSIIKVNIYDCHF